MIRGIIVGSLTANLTDQRTWLEICTKIPAATRPRSCRHQQAGDSIWVVNLILCEPEEVRADGTLTLTDTRAAHVREVLRASVGDEVRVGIVDGPHGVATIA